MRTRSRRPTSFQFTPLRDRRQRGDEYDAQAQKISIHAPPRGATGQLVREGSTSNISIHAPPRGATKNRKKNAKKGLFQFTPLREGRRDRRRRANRVDRNFNSRPSARGDVHPCVHHTQNVYFNSRPSARGDGQTDRRTSAAAHFNSRPSARGDEEARNLQEAGHHFNSRPSARGDVPDARTPGRREFQFTPLREGRRNQARWRLCVRYFNSRPSARGDFCGFPTTFALQISIHAPPRGATPRRTEERNGTTHFNSRPSARGDGQPRRKEGTHGQISIHAPPRGATYPQTVDFPAFAISIHAPPRGATHRTADVALHSGFQFTPLREGRLRSFALGLLASLISIHAPPRGATEPRRLADRVANAFQFTPLREGRRTGRMGVHHQKHFNSRPSARGDYNRLHHTSIRSISIHAPPRGATTGTG